MAKKNFKQLITSPDPVLVDFYADWCQPCHALAPEIRKVANKTEGRMKVVKVNVDKNQHAAAKYQVRSIPTLILFKQGKVVWRGSGVMREQQLMDVLSPHL